MAMTADNAKRISRGRMTALGYSAMAGLTDEPGIDAAVTDCIADLLHALVAEPFERAGLEAAEKDAIATDVVGVALGHFRAELMGETE